LSKTPVIAIVDDDEAVREALLDLLQVEGYSGRTFDGAPSFLAEYAPGAFDCLITDVRMPGIDGLEMQQRLRALGSNIPVIVVSSLTDEVTRSRALKGGAIGYLTKPVADEILLNLLRAAIGRDFSSDNPHAGEHPPKV
jgi:FixJ family two-component response regulator